MQFMYQCELQISGVVAVVCISKYIMCNQDLTITLDSVYCMRQRIYTHIQEQKLGDKTNLKYERPYHVVSDNIIVHGTA